MEARIARIESDVAHPRTDVADIKVDMRALRDKVDGVEALLHEKFDSLRDGIVELKDDSASLRGDIAAAKIWALFLYIALAAANAGALARGMGWI